MIHKNNNNKNNNNNNQGVFLELLVAAKNTRMLDTITRYINGFIDIMDQYFHY